MGNKYLSQVLTFEDLHKELEENNNRLCIISGVGSGKNFFIEKELAEKSNENIFLVSSRRIKVQEIKREEEFNENINIEEITNQHKFVTTNFGVEKILKSKQYDPIINHFEYFIIDECHSIFTDATFADASFHVLKLIEYIEEKYPHKKIILMTGTPEPIDSYLKRNKWRVLDYRKECISIKPKKIKIIEKKEVLELINTELEKKHKILYMTTSASKIADNENKFVEDYITPDKEIIKSGIAKCVSISRACKMNQDEQEKMELTMESIINDSIIPEEIKILLCSSCLKEGVNIHDGSVKIAFCESHLLSDIQQFMGRIRNELECLYIIGDVKQYALKQDFQEMLLECRYLKSAGMVSMNKFIDELKDRIVDNEKGLNVLIELGITEKISSPGYIEMVRKFVDMMESKTYYARYNLLKDEFELYLNRLQEKMRIKFYNNSDDLPEAFVKEKKWEDKIADYCKLEDIDFELDYARKGEVLKKDIKKLNKLLEKISKSTKNKVWIIDPLKTEIMNTIYKLIGWKFNKHGSIKKINKKLEELKMPYFIEKGKRDKKNGIKISKKSY